MFEYDETLIMALFIYFGTCYFLYSLKHPKMFDVHDNFRCFGLDEGDTVFPFWLVTTVVGLSAYYGLLIYKGEYE